MKAKAEDVNMYLLDLESLGYWPTVPKNFPGTGPDLRLCLLAASKWVPPIVSEWSDIDRLHCALSLTFGFNSDCLGGGGHLCFLSEERQDPDVEDFERRRVDEFLVCGELVVASSYESAYGDPTAYVPGFVSLMIYVSSYFLLHYFGILYKVECCITI